MSQNKELVRIEPETVGTYLGEHARPLIIACLLKDRDLAENLRQLKDVSAEFQKQGLMVCYTLDDMLPFFTSRFNVGGTPTYLMIASGIVLGTMLGKNSSSSLIKFVHEMLSGYKPAKDTCNIRKKRTNHKNSPSGKGRKVQVR